jgi:hypothetical protein
MSGSKAGHVYLRHIAEDWERVYTGFKARAYYDVILRPSRSPVIAFHASKFSSSFDDATTGLQVDEKAFKKRANEILTLAYHFRLQLVIRQAGRPKLLLEPTEEGFDHILERLDLDRGEFRDLLLKGELGDIVGGDPEKIRRRYERRLQAQKGSVAVSERKAEQAAAAAVKMKRQRDAANLQTEIVVKENSDLKGKLARVVDDKRISKETPTAPAPISPAYQAIKDMDRYR